MTKDVELGVYFGLRDNSGYRLDKKWEVLSTFPQRNVVADQL